MSVSPKLTTPALATISEPRYGRSITVIIQFPCGRLFRHSHVFNRTPTDRNRARQLVSKINVSGGLTVLYVHASKHWIRTGRMSGCVQVNKVTASNFETTESTGYDGKPTVRYQLSGPVARHWGAMPKPGAMWDFGSQYDFTGRTHDEIKADVESKWNESIFSCDSMEQWPYVDTEIEAALAEQAATVAV